MHEHDLRFEVAGDILSTTSESIREQLSQRLESSGASLGLFELDLPRTHMIDSVGLNLLVWLIKQVGARNGKLRIRLADANVMRTVRFTRLDRHAEIVHC